MFGGKRNTNEKDQTINIFKNDKNNIYKDKDGWSTTINGKKYDLEMDFSLCFISFF